MHIPVACSMLDALHIDLQPTLENVMPTIIHKIHPETIDWRILRDLCLSLYLDDECYAFATALHQGLDWPILGLMNGEEIRHAVVQDPDGVLHDARGPLTEEELGDPFAVFPPYDLRPITMDDLRRKGEPSIVREGSVRNARKLAEMLWPELPWIGSLAARVRAFADELEALSRKHKLWIRASVPAVPPIIADGDDAESGYLVNPVSSTLSFTIDRFY